MEPNLSFKDRAKQAFYFYARIGQGVVDTVKGIAKLSLLPATQGIAALEKTADFISHPQQKAEAAYQEAKQDYKDLQKLWNHPKEEVSKRTEKITHAINHEWQEFKKPFQNKNPNVRAKAWGEITFNVGSLFVGPGELKGLMTVEKEVSVLSKAARVEEALVTKLPHGFSSPQELKEFANIFTEGLAKTGDAEAVGILRGSAVTGVKFKSGLPFDVGGRSDLDLAVVSPKLLGRAEEWGIPLRSSGTRSAPLGIIKPKDRVILKQLQLLKSVEQLGNLSNRKISIMIYETEAQLSQRGKYLKF